MPSRVLREGILTSDRVDKLSIPAELFYRRLMSVVDDFGRFDARPVILKVNCYPLRVDVVREADISRWIAECEKAGLIVLYAVDSKPYLGLTDFRQAVRAKQSKYPPPANAPPMRSTCDADATRVHSRCDAHAPVVEDEDEDEDERARQARLLPAPAPPPRRKSPLPADFVVSERVAAWAKEKGHTMLDRHLEHFIGLAKARGYKYLDWDEALMNAIRGNWANLEAPRRTTPPQASRRVSL